MNKFSYFFYRSIIFIFLLSIFNYAEAQNNGDTIEIRSFNYNQTYGINQWSPGIRDTMVAFPNDSNLTFEKILMLYNIRCKNGNVSPAVSGQTDIGCGEWDASCNTYITDSSRVDSVLSFHPSHWISQFSGTSFAFLNQPLNHYFRHILKNIQLDSIISDTINQIGLADTAHFGFFPYGKKNVKSQYLFTQQELLNSGVSSGIIDGIKLNFLDSISETKFLKISIKQTSLTALSDSLIESFGFTEVYFHNYNFVNGENRIYFYQPFVWDGLSNILIEISYSNDNINPSVEVASSELTFNSSLTAFDDNQLIFNGSNYIVASGYKGIPGSQSRTIEAWIKTDVVGKDFISWGSNNGGKKWIFKTHTNGGLRVEINGGYVYGSTNIADNQWHHIAVVMNGININSLSFYIDGVLETNLTSSNLTINTDTTNGIDVVISQGFHGRYITGLLDEVRIWSTALTPQILKNGRYSKIDSTHSAFSFLELYYTMDEKNDSIVFDHSPHGRHGKINGLGNRNILKGQELFKSFSVSQIRPVLGVLQGIYQLTVTNDTILDTIQQIGNQVISYQIDSKQGTMESDIVEVASDTLLWQAGYEYYIDAITGIVIDSIYRSANGTINIAELHYFKRYPMKYEIMSFVTPYGINLDLGMSGKTWTFDLTDFAPVLKGNKRMTVERGGQWMEDMDIRFLFIVGTPPRNTIDIQQLWKVDSRSYTDIMNDRAYESRTLKMHPDGKSYKIRSVITGHGQEGEFIPRQHNININGGSSEFSWNVWKACGQNPIYPQGGTWIYDRAGWCPGAPSNLKEMDITPYVIAGQTSEIDYTVSSASGTSNYIVNNQIVSYGLPNFSIDATIDDILAPTEKVEYARSNMICTNPTVRIKNTGSSPLTNATITYWTNDDPTPSTYQWSGNLDFLEYEDVILPIDSAFWYAITPTENTFHAKASNPNGQQDQYSFNDSYHAKFKIPQVLPSNFMIFLVTNGAPQETSYKLYNENNDLIFHKTGLSAQTIYKDTFHLGVGCYRLELLDSDGDGLKFFANNDGNGSFNIRQLNNALIKTFNPDFGDKVILNFTVDFPLKYEDIYPEPKISIYPNPTNNQLNIEFGKQVPKRISLLDIRGNQLMEMTEIAEDLKTKEIDLSRFPSGTYIFKIDFKNTSTYQRVIKI
ncbi:MAG: T9SS type A sorting domain-containing protein [Bacteroidales bacterium]|nr:T9SS type A sorting domain-containing protein [Bacteroidales bacterium]